MRRAQAGDGAAFGDLVTRTTPMVRGIIASKVGSSEDIEDLTQDVFLKALRGISGLEDTNNFEGWIATIARNSVADFHRSRARRPTSPLSEIDEEPAEGDITAEEYAELHALAASVRVGVGRLAPLDAALIAMVSLLGFTPSDVSAALGISPGAAKVAVHRARKRLRQSMLLDDAAGTPAAPCKDFRDLAGSGLLVPAALHARECPQCSTRPKKAAGSVG